jgi:hypothetical protein
MPSSPDIPAYYSYLIVSLFGAVVAISTVNDRLTLIPDRWGFRDTWALFFAYSAVPVVLFWFLDYGSVIQDTSLYAAVLVGFGYQSIFGGSIQSISLPADSASFWKPFQAWVSAVSDRIAAKQKTYQDNFVRRLELKIAGDPDLILKLLGIVKDHLPEAITPPAAPSQPTPAAPPPAQQTAAAQSAAQPAPNPAPIVTPATSAQLQAAFDALPVDARLQKFRLLWRVFRAAEPSNYGYILYKNDFIFPLRYWLQFRSGRAAIMSWGTIAAFVLVCFSAWHWLAFPAYAYSNLVYGDGSSSVQNLTSGNSVIRYYQWRLDKPNASDSDKFRSKTYVNLMASQAVDCEGLTAFEKLMSPIIDHLCFNTIPSNNVDEMLRLVVSEHSPLIDTRIVPQLINCLWTDDPDKRLRIHQTLIALQQADYPESLPESDLGDFQKWIPAKDEKAGDIEKWIEKWRRKAQAEESTGCRPRNPTKTAG